MTPTTTTPAAPTEDSPDVVEVTVDRPANGGEAVGRLDGRVVFVRGAVPGETVRARVRERSRSFWRAETVEVIEASAHRIEPLCPAAANGAGCCDLSFIDPGHARTLKHQVLADVLSRVGRFGPDLPPLTAVAALASDDVGWRVRTRLGVDDAGVAGQRAHHSDTVIAGADCVAPERGMLAGLDDFTFTPGADVLVVADADHNRHLAELAPVTAATGGRRRRAQRTRTRRNAIRPVRVLDGSETVTHRVGGRTWQLPITAFWQAHRDAPETYAQAVTELIATHATRPVRTVWDLYGGVGVLGSAVLDDPRAEFTGLEAVHVVESATDALTAATETFASDDRMHLHAGEVADTVGGLPRPDAVILDPPRTGAGERVIESVAAAGPSVIVHVGCDAARFARDLGLFAQRGYTPVEIRGYDAFPLTHHVEAIAALVPAADAEKGRAPGGLRR